MAYAQAQKYLLESGKRGASRAAKGGALNRFTVVLILL